MMLNYHGNMVPIVDEPSETEKMDMIVDNIKCNKCDRTLPPHTVRRHLDKDDVIHKSCPLHLTTRYEYTDTYYVDQPHSKIIDLFAMEYTYSQLEPYTTHIKTNNEQDPLVSLRVEIEDDRVEKKLYVTVYIDGEMLGVGDAWDAGTLYHLRALCGLNDLKIVSRKKMEGNISVYDPEYEEEN